MADEILPLFPMMIIELPPTLAVCVVCKRTFEKKQHTQFYCSPQCRARITNREKLIDLICPWCTTGFTQTHNRQVFCSKKCQSKHRERRPEHKAYKRTVQDRRNAQQRERLSRQNFLTRRLPYFNHNYGSKITSQDLIDLFEAQTGLCVLCGTVLMNGNCEIDHIIAVKHQGTTTPDNLQLLCFMCNRGKWTCSVEEYVMHCLRVANKARAEGADIPEKPSKKRGSKASY